MWIAGHGQSMGAAILPPPGAYFTDASFFYNRQISKKVGLNGKSEQQGMIHLDTSFINQGKFFYTFLTQIEVKIDSESVECLCVFP